MAILLGFHGNINLKKVFFNDYSSKTTEAVGLLFGTNVKWLRAVENSHKSANLPLGMVAMATENFHRLIMRKRLNCIFSITSEVM